MEEQPIPYERLILVCLNQRGPGEPSCGGRNSAPLADALKSAVDKAGLKGRIRVSKTYCLGRCEMGPNVMIYPEGTFLSHVSEADVPSIVNRFIKAETK